MRLRNERFGTGMLIAAFAVVLSVTAGLMLMSGATFAFADDTGSASDILEPQHGIPLVIVNIDESEEGIAAAREEDPKHEYGTIEEMNDSSDHSVRCVGNVEINVPEGYAIPGGDLAWIGKELKLDYIRGRGNSTWEGIPKRPYKIQLSKKADLFGMGKSKDWALMANFFDKTLMHNRITYWLGEQLGMPYTIESVPVDVVMTGADGPVYLGCYDLSETIKVEDTRIAMDKLGEEPDSTEGAGDADYQKTGGYLFSIFSDYQKDDPESNTFTTKNLVDFHFDNPEYMVEAELTDWQKEQRQYLRDYVQDVEDLIIDCDEIDAARHDEINKLLDLKSVADYWLMQEFTINGDAYFTGSTYFHKPRGDKMYFGPLWDFDLAWGEDGDNIEGFNNTIMVWIDELRAKDPKFVEIMNQEWAKMDTALTELTKSDGIIEQYREEVRAAYGADPKIADLEDADLDEQAESLLRWTDARHDWFKKNKDKFGAVYATVTYVADGKTVFINNKARIGRAADDDPAVPEKEGFFFTGWFTEDGTAMEDVNIEEDTVFYANYVDEDHAILPTDLYLQDYELWAETDSSLDPGSVTILPSGVVSERITWKSSDENIATVDSLGLIYTHNAGDVILTASTLNGVEKEILLHVAPEGTLELKDPTGIVFDEPEMKLKTGENAQAKWHFIPEGEPINKDVYLFETSDDMVVDVDSLGVLTANGPGTAEVTMEVLFGEDQKISGTFKVTVTDPDVPSDYEGTASGTIHKVGGNTYKVLKNAGARKVGSVALIKAANNKSVKVPGTVTINHKKFNVTQINAKAFCGKKIRTVTIGKNVKTIKKNAFAGSKATKLIVTSKKLTKKSVKGSLNKSKIKRVQVKVGKKSVNRKYRNKYKKIFTRKNAGKKVKI